MPRIPTQRKRILPSGQVPSVRIPAGTFAAEIRAGDVSGTAQQVAGIAAGVAQKLDNIEVNTQVSQTEGFINEKRAEMRDFAADNLDHTLYQAKWKELQAQIDSFAGQVKNPRARRNVQNFITQNKALWQDRVNGFENRGRITAGQLELDNAINRIIVADVSQDAAILGMTAEDVKASAIENHIQAAVDNDLITPQQGDKLRLASDKAIKKFVTEEIKANVSEGAFDAWQDTVTDANPDGDLRPAFDFVQASDAPDKQEIESEVKTRVTNRRIENKIALENQQEADRDILGKRLAGVEGLPPLDFTAIDNSSLPEAEQEQWRVRMNTEAERKAKGEVIVTNEQVRASLRSSAVNIWRGADTKANVVVLLNEARFGETPTIDDAAYKELSTLAETKLEKVQADFLAEVHRDGQEQLVDLTRETQLALIVAGHMTELQSERHKVQLWRADRFDNEMEQWIQDNPDKNKREGYQQSQMVLATYINAPHEEIEALRTRTLQSLQEEAETLRTRTEGETAAADFLAKHPLESIDVTAKPPVSTKRIVRMQGPEGGQASVGVGAVGTMLDKGLKFPPGSDIRVKRNTSNSPVNFEGLVIEPGKRVISFDGGKTWQLLP